MIDNLVAITMLAASQATAPVPYAEGSAQQRTATAIARVQAIDPQIHSVIALDPTAMEQASRIDQSRRSGGIAGEPVLLKDNIEAAGPLPTTAGSLALANNVTNRDAPLVARLRAAGAVILGKTNLSEWANIRSNHSISGWSAIGGQTRNPWALDRNPCGSSSGSGAAVAAGLVRMAIGTETDGSVTCPAALNGIVGLKPTVGLVSRTHVVPISHSQDTAGPMAASVREAAMLLSAIAGSDPADPATREADRHRTDYAALLDRQFAQGQADRGDALRLGLRHRRGVRNGTGRASRTRCDVGRDQEVRRPVEGWRRAQGPADRAQGRSRDVPEGKPRPNPGAQPRGRDRIRQGKRQSGDAAVRPGYLRGCAKGQRLERPGLQKGARSELSRRGTERHRPAAQAI